MRKNEGIKYVYFIYSLEKNKNREILSEHKPKILTTKIIKDDKNIDFNVNLYEITIDKTKVKKKETTTKIQLTDKDNNKNTFDYFIDIADKNQNIYLYDIEFRNSSNFFAFFSPILPPRYNLSIEEKYEMFRTIIKNDEDDGEEIKERKMDDLIYYTQKKLEKEKRYNFSFFASVFNDIDLKKIHYIEKHFELFNIKKVIFDKEKILFNLNIRKIIFFLQVYSEKNYNQ